MKSSLTIIALILIVLPLFTFSQNKVQYSGDSLYNVTEHIIDYQLYIETVTIGYNPKFTFNTISKGWNIVYTTMDGKTFGWTLEHIKDMDDCILMKDNGGDYWEVMDNISERGVILFNKNRKPGTPYIKIDGIVKVKN
ncbi:MAG: hypothetical protein JXR58_09910 [Bacteroidales bacterium]|nr:hypothetical protein [Bacteroidales bacterium]